MEVGVRVLKAWRVEIKGCDDPGTYYAATRNKARFQAWHQIREVWGEVKFSDIRRCVRVPHLDIVLPGRHRLTAELDARDRDIILNAYGGGAHIPPEKWGYRDHYCTAPGDTRLLRLSWELGLFSGPFGEREHGSTPGWAGAFYYLTDLGKHVARSLIDARRLSGEGKAGES